MSNVIKITPSKLAELLFAMSFVNGAAVIASVLQFTDPKLKKTGNPYPNVKKLTKLSILLNTEYEKGVLNQLKREDKEPTEYVKGANTMPLQFGENNRFIGTFNGEPALQYRPYDKSHPVTKYVQNGKIIDKAKIESFLPAKKVATNQGTDKEILWRKLYLKNVRRLAINGQHYKLIPETV